MFITAFFRTPSRAIAINMNTLGCKIFLACWVSDLAHFHRIILHTPGQVCLLFTSAVRVPCIISLIAIADG